MTSNKDMVENMERCPSFERCSKNFCPLDYELELRSGASSDKCKYMREPGRTRILNGKEFTEGGAIMPDELLKYVPKYNASWLNSENKKRHKELARKARIFTKNQGVGVGY